LIIFDWVKNKEKNTDFEKVFASLKKMGKLVPSANKTYELLKELNFETSELQAELLISEFDKIQYASNTNSYFYFYFPIVTHILYYKPKFEKETLRYLIEPNFANGDTETKELIPLIQSAMQYKLSENKNYLTDESKKWITHELPKMEKEVEREVQKCWKELKD